MDKNAVKKTYRNVIFVEDDDGTLSKYIRCEPKKRPAPKKKPPPPKKYEIQAAALPNCSVHLVQLTNRDIHELKKKVERECKVEKIQKELKSSPVLKICDFVRFAMVIEPNLQFVNDDINFQSVSNDTLHLMEQYMFPKENATSDYFDDEFHCEGIYDNATSQLVNVRNNECEIDPFIELFIGNWFNMETFLSNVMHANADGFRSDIDKSIVAIYQSNRSAKLKNDGNLITQLPNMDGDRNNLKFSEQMWHYMITGLSVEFHGNNCLAIRLPEINGKRSTFIISKQVLCNLFAAHGLPFDQFFVRNDVVDVASLVKSFSTIQLQEQRTQTNMLTYPKEIDTPVIAETSRMNVIDDLQKLFAKDWFVGAKMAISTDCGADHPVEIIDKDDTMLSVSSSSQLSFQTRI